MLLLEHYFWIIHCKSLLCLLLPFVLFGRLEFSLSACRPSPLICIPKLSVLMWLLSCALLVLVSYFNKITFEDGHLYSVWLYRSTRLPSQSIIFIKVFLSWFDIRHSQWYSLYNSHSHSHNYHQPKMPHCSPYFLCTITNTPKNFWSFLERHDVTSGSLPPYCWWWWLTPPLHPPWLPSWALQSLFLNALSGSENCLAK